MCIATASKQGLPSARYVLLKVRSFMFEFPIEVISTLITDALITQFNFVVWILHENSSLNHSMK